MALHLIVHGIVQGVGYRESMRYEAKRLGITGWVRNRLDHTVEAVIDGGDDALAIMLDWAKRGPAAARVDAVETQKIEGRFKHFEVRPTA